ncbi:MAG TPA: aromatic-ring-hydroxylating dioxygenase subunit beta [Chloroflexota bacterium]|nr:aromatic-ring-hydroxylating dioxygenase subunit beta [Chloroflexota bacterium]
MATWEQKREIEEFLYREAYLLDDHRLDEWLALFTDDVEYLVPLREHVQGDVAPAGHPVIRDDKMMLLARVKKHQTGLSHVEIPQSMTGHLITNILVEDGPAPGELEVRSSFVVRQARKLRDEAWWVGRRRDLFRHVDNGWKIARREVLLDHTVLPRGISIFF